MTVKPVVRKGGALGWQASVTGPLVKGRPHPVKSLSSYNQAEAEAKAMADEMNGVRRTAFGEWMEV